MGVAVSQDNDVPPVETVDMKLPDVVSMIRGAKGTKVKLHVKPKGTGTTQIYEITRDLIKLEDEAARGEVVEHGMKPDGTKYKTGYINLPSFYLDMDAARKGVKNYRSTRVTSTTLVESILERSFTGYRDKGIQEC